MWRMYNQIRDRGRLAAALRNYDGRSRRSRDAIGRPPAPCPRPIGSAAVRNGRDTVDGSARTDRKGSRGKARISRARRKPWIIRHYGAAAPRCARALISSRPVENRLACGMWVLASTRSGARIRQQGRGENPPRGERGRTFNAWSQPVPARRLDASPSDRGGPIAFMLPARLTVELRTGKCRLIDMLIALDGKK